MDCSAPQSANQCDRGKWSVSFPLSSPTHTAPVGKKYLTVQAVDKDDDEGPHTPLADLPASDNAVSEHTLKQMLLSLQKKSAKRYLQLSLPPPNPN